MEPRTVPAVWVAGLLLLTLFLVPAGFAAAPSWTVAASSGDELSAVVISEDGSTIVAGGDQLVALSPSGSKLWSGWSGATLDISSDGQYIVTSQGMMVRLFNRQGVLLWDHALKTVVTSVSISPDAAIVAAGGGGIVQSWYNSGSGLGENTTGAVQVLKISPVKDQILIGTVDALESFNLSYVPNWDDDTVSPSILAVSGDGTGIVIPNGNHVLMFHGSGTRLWDRSFTGGNIISLAYSKDGSTIVAGRDDATVLVLDRNGDLLWKGNAGTWVTSVAVSDNSSVIATGSIDCQVHVFDRQGRELVNGTTENAIKSRSVAVSGDGSLVAVVDSRTVYGFSTAQYTQPVSVTPTGVITQEKLGNTTALTVPGTTVQTMGSPAGTAMTTAAMADRASTLADLPWLLVPVAFVIMVLAKRR